MLTPMTPAGESNAHPYDPCRGVQWANVRLPREWTDGDGGLVENWQIIGEPAVDVSDAPES